MAHALHPSYPDKHDKNNAPIMGKGIVLKENANDAYASSGLSLTLAKALCEEAEVPMQSYICPQDMRCGSTIGPTLSSQLNCPTVDLGPSMWGMHSAY